MSKSREILAMVLMIVAEETEVTADKIVSRCSNSEVVDARWICVKMLKECGYYPSRIAELLHITPRYVQYILTDFEDRLAVGEMMRINYEHSAKKLRSAYERTYGQGYGD